jgi:thimet oligopeptidase
VSRLDVYRSLLAAKANTDENALDPESKRLLDHMLRDRRRAGLALEEDQREKLKAINKEISNLSIDFRKNLGEEKGKIEFTKEVGQTEPATLTSPVRPPWADNRELGT